MAVTREEISSWFDRGVIDNQKYMIIVCDTFDHDDYPCFFETLESAKTKAKNPGEMQRVMEIYDLTADKQKQIKMHRCFAFEF